MEATMSPTRLGIWDALVPRLAAAGWIDGGEVAPAAVPRLHAVRTGPDPEGALERLTDVLDGAPELAAAALHDHRLGEALGAIVGASRALSRTIRSHPAWLAEAAAEAEPVFEPPEPETGAVRRFVRRGLLRVAVRDLLGRADMPRVGRELADLADAAAAAALDLAHAEARQRPDHADLPPVPYLVVAMGKWGGRELNYASDIDILFVYDTPDGADPTLVNGYAQRVASSFIDALGGVTPEGVAFRVDADLRPEGKAGPLARSLDAYAAYYDRWAEPWEFQALIKARPAAGDPDLAQAFTDLTTPHVYPDTLPPDTIRHVRTMKARIEKERIPPHEDAAFHMKLGPGGLADVEFTAQLLQLRHGGRQARVRVAGTLAALEALDADHLISPADARTLADAYRFCARIRNRLFLQAGKVRDSLPGDADEATRLALSLGYDLHPLPTLREEYRRRTRRARRVVERVFYGLEQG